MDLFPKSAKKLNVTIRLIQSLKSSYGALTAMHHLPIDYIDADDMVPFCREPIDLSNEEWRSLLRIEVLSTKTDENAEPVEKIVCVDSDSEEECVDAEPAQPKITSLSEAIEMLHDLAEFSERRLQDESLVSSLNKVCSAVQNLRIQNFRQKRISDYFGTTPGVHS